MTQLKVSTQTQTSVEKLVLDYFSEYEIIRRDTAWGKPWLAKLSSISPIRLIIVPELNHYYFVGKNNVEETLINELMPLVVEKYFKTSDGIIIDDPDELIQKTRQYIKQLSYYIVAFKRISKGKFIVSIYDKQQRLVKQYVLKILLFFDKQQYDTSLEKMQPLLQQLQQQLSKKYRYVKVGAGYVRVSRKHKTLVPFALVLTPYRG